jgi:hypothetical protein
MSKHIQQSVPDARYQIRETEYTVKVKFALEQAMKANRESRGIVLFL